LPTVLLGLPNLIEDRHLLSLKNETRATARALFAVSPGGGQVAANLFPEFEEVSELEKKAEAFDCLDEFHEVFRFPGGEVATLGYVLRNFSNVV
jgi:hypothetical protein